MLSTMKRSQKTREGACIIVITTETPHFLMFIRVLNDISVNYKKNEISESQVYSHWPWPILIQIFRPLCAVDFSSHYVQTDRQTHKQERTSFIY